MVLADQIFWLWQFIGRLHPLIVHFPIGFLFATLLLEVIDWKRKSQNFKPAIELLLWLGMVGALAAVVFGFLLAWQDAADGESLVIHRGFGVATAAASLLTLWLFLKKRVRAYRVLLLTTVAVTTVAGHYGASLTHGEHYLSEVLPSGNEESPSDDGIAAITFVGTKKDLTQEQVQELNLQVRTVLAHNCYSCHGEAKSKGGLRLDSREALFKGGKGGAVVTPGDPGSSELIRRVVLPAGHKKVMPQKGRLLRAEEIALLKLWIEKGAPWPDVEKSIYRVADLEPRKPQVPPATGDLILPVDRFVNAYFKENQIDWTPVVNDRIYIRRVYLDIVGLLPPVEKVEQFVKDSNPQKRALVVKELLDRNGEYAQHWISFWNDALRNDYSGTGYITGGRFDITQWLYNALLVNKPYNWFVKELVNPTRASEGFIKGIRWRGTINSSQRTEMQAAQNVAQVFLGLNLKCASCHDSFISDWKLEDAYAFANIFADTTLEINRCDKPTGKRAGRKIIFDELGKITEEASTKDRLKELSEFLTHPRDGRLYRTLVNRIWAQLMGRGIVEPVDEMDNLPWSADLLDWLATDFVESGYDVKDLIYKIMTSRAYQLSSVSLQDAGDLNAAQYKFKGMIRRRLTAEQFADAVSYVFVPVYSDSSLMVKLFPADLPATLPFVRASLVKNDQFLTALGRPNRETVTTSRANQANLLQALELTNGTKLSETLIKGSALWQRKYNRWGPLITDLYRRALGRDPESAELDIVRKLPGKVPEKEGIEDLVWAVIVSPEFQLIY